MDRPEIPRDAVTCRHSVSSRFSGVYVDRDAGLIHFENSHTPRGFLTSMDDWFSCDVSRIVRVHNTRRPKVGWCLTIVTDVGVACIRASDADYSELHAELVDLVPRNDPAFLMHDPAIETIKAVWIAVGACLGCFIGWWLVPLDSSDTRLAVYVAVGIGLGLCLNMALLALVDRWLQASYRREVE